MKKVFLLASLLISLVSYSQFPANGTKNQWKQGIALGSKDSTSFGVNDSLILTIDRSGKLLWRGNGVGATWKIVADNTTAVGTVTSIATNNGTGINGGTITSAGTLSIDTTNISTRLFRIKGTDSLGALIALKVSIADTANMLSTYQRILANYSTTYALSNDVRDSIQTKLALRDTAGMLSGYTKVQRFTDSLTAVQGRVQSKLALSDTAAMLSPYARTSNLPSLAPYKLIADTFFVNGYTTRARTKQGLDSLAALIPSSSNFVPYNGAVTNVNLGNFRLTSRSLSTDSIYANGSGGLHLVSNSGTQVALLGAGGGAGTTFYGGIVGTTGSFASSGSGTTFAINHSSGSGIGLDITKGGNGEGLYINKTSGSGNAATIVGTLEATTLVKTGGTSSQFLKADGSVDGTAYGTGSVTSVATNTGSGITGGTITTTGTIAADTTILSTKAYVTGQLVGYATTGSLAGKLNISDTAAMLSNYRRKTTLIENADLRNSAITINGSSTSLGGSVSVGTVTSVATSAPITGGTITSTGTIGITQATTSTDGYLSATDWNTFNNKASTASVALKLNISDTASMLSNYRRTTTKITNSDLVNSTISGIALGSNLNSLTAGNGLSGTAYNGSAAQTWRVDTSVISTKANVTGLLVGYTTVAANALKLNISDTATMLTYYLRNRTGLSDSYAIGNGSMLNSTSGTRNIGLGSFSLQNNTDGGNNVAIGYEALKNGSSISNNTAIGYAAGSAAIPTDVENSVYLGYNSTPQAFSSVTNEIVIGASTTGNGSNTVTIGNSSVTNNYFSGNVRATAFIPTGGSSSQFLKGDGSLDGTSYATAASISGTTNYIPKFTSSSAIGNSAIYDNSGNIGVGTTAAVVNFQVNGSSEVYSALSVAGTRYLQFGADGSASYINSYNSSPLIFSTSTGTSFSERLRISSTGNVGIGTTSPAVRLVGTVLSLNNATQSSLELLYNGSSAGEIFANSGAFVLGAYLSGTHMEFRTANTERMRITSDGNVGIGTSSPTNSKVHISKASSETAPNEQIRMQSTGGAVPSTWRFDVNASNGSFAITDNNFGERMIITNGGNVLIKTTTDNGTDALQVAGSGLFSSSVTASGNGSAFGTTANSTIPVTIQANSSNQAIKFLNASGGQGSISFTGTSTSMSYFFNTNSNSNVLQIAENGAVTLSSLGTGTVYSNSGTLTNVNPSDSTIKNTINPHKYGLAEILKLQPKSFYYNSDSAKSNLKYGFIAQEVEKIMPDMVRKINPSDSTSKLGLESNGIYVTLVNAIKEQQAQIELLKAQLEALKPKQ